MAMKIRPLALALATLLFSSATSANMPALSRVTPSMSPNQNWHYATQPPAKLVQALEETLQGLQKQTIAIKKIEDFGDCQNTDQFVEVFAGLTQVSAYYYLFGHLADGQHAYFNPLAKPADYYLKHLNPETLKHFANLAIKSLNKEQKRDILIFAHRLSFYYARLFDHLIAEDLSSLTEKMDAGFDGFLKEELDRKTYLPKAQKDSCYSKWLSTETIGAYFFDYGDDSYFSFDTEAYFYSFWFRRFYHGTAEQTKELLDYVIEELKK